MNEEKQTRLEAAGWRVGTVQEFFNLSNREMGDIERRVAQTKPLDPAIAKALNEDWMSLVEPVSKEEVTK